MCLHDVGWTHPNAPIHGRSETGRRLQARNHELDAKRNGIGGKDDPLDVFLCVSRLGCGTMTALSSCYHGD